MFGISGQRNFPMQKWTQCLPQLCSNSSSHCPQCQVPYRLVKSDLQTGRIKGAHWNMQLQFFPSGYSRAEILEHFGGYHDEDVFIHNGNCAHIRFADIVTVARGVGDFWWSPVLINYENNETGPLFLILSSTNAKENLTSLMCVLLWADEQANNVLNLFADFSLKSVTDDVPDFKLTLPAVHIQQAKSFLEDGIPWKVSTSFLTQHYLSETEGGRDVVFEVTLTQRNEPKVKIESGELVQTSVFGSRRKRSKLNTPQTNGQSQTLALDRAPIPSTSSFNSQSQTPLPGEYIFQDPVNVFCDSCNLEPIHGIRYKCTQCADYDLCSNCVQQGGHHDHHIFVLIRNAVQNKDLVRWQDRAASKTPKLLNKEADPMDEDASEITTSKDFTCEKCSKKTTICERLYRCLTCADCLFVQIALNRTSIPRNTFLQ
ncbi:ZZ-type zinc finger-containing protein P35G2.11c [Orchesella cincta]|uniref:ZZ-type zinc finger-containing protein P35G2.11c n=1 Tax=Orchesella cincta TaxID=48709 RepID=A0A1D2MDJ7_ORCCI|nr:ZZ-type zinc finger-containing protein P35G2.11c [Orchesella cincta]